MFFRVIRRGSEQSIARFGLSRFRQSTALIGATLLFCMSGVGAEAQTIYYNYNSPDAPEDGPNPQNGGSWSSNTSNDYWVQRFNNGTYDNGDTDFRDGDDVHFLTEGTEVIAIEIENDLDPDEIVVEEGTFVFNDLQDTDDGDNIDGNSLTINADGNLTIAAAMSVSGAIQIDGDLVVAEDWTFNATSTTDAVEVGEGGALVVDGTLVTAVGVNVTSGIDGNGDPVVADLVVNGTVNGAVTLDENSTLTLGQGSFISGVVTLNGTTFTGGERIGRLVVGSGSDVTFGGARAQIDRTIENAGNLTLGVGTYSGGLTNTGSLTLAADVVFGDADNPRYVENGTGATLSISGGDRTLTTSGNFGNFGTLNAGTDRLTIVADQILLQSSGVLTGDVILSGDIENSSTLNMVHVPTLDGTFLNTSTGSVTVSMAVDGNGQVFTNAGTLTVAGGPLTGLSRLDNTGTVLVGAGNTLGAAAINHTAGTLTSRGTLVGAVTSGAATNLQGAITGRYTMTDNTTTITDDLTVTTAAGGGSVAVEGGTLVMAVTTGGTTLTTPTLTNDGVVDLGAGGNIIAGDVVNDGTLTGQGQIAGDLTFQGGGGTEYTGTRLAVQGSLINDLNGSVNLSRIIGPNAPTIIFNNLVNDANLTINRNVDRRVTNNAGATLTVNNAIDNTLITAGTTGLNANVTRNLVITGGATTIGAPVTVGTTDQHQVIVEQDGTLDVTGGNLTTTGAVRATGEVFLSLGSTLTTPLLAISGDSGSLIRGRVDGVVNVQDGAAVALDGAIISGRLTNAGRLDSESLSARATLLQGGLFNTGQVDLTQGTQPVQITGILRNGAGGVAEVDGNVIAGGGRAGDVTNLGNLTLNGDVAGTISNQSVLNFTGDAAKLNNQTGADAIVDGAIGVAGVLTEVDLRNLGTLRMAGRIGNSLQNQGTATFNGTIGGSANNTGTLNLRGIVGQNINNSAAGAMVNIIGNTTAANLLNAGTTNIRSGNTLTLGSAALQNQQNATLNVEGTLASAAGGGLVLTNDAGGTVIVADSGTVNGDLDNAGTATITGTVAGDIGNQAGATVTLDNGGTVSGVLTNQGTVTLLAGDTATVDGGTVNDGGTLNLSGRLESSVQNYAGSTINLTNGTVVGNVVNAAGADIVSSSGTIVGDLTNNGTYTLDFDGRVDGNFINNGLLTQSVDNSSLTAAESFVNNGTIDVGAFSTITINSTNYVNNGVTRGDVIITGTIGNNDTFVVDTDRRLFDDLNNADDATIRVWATYTGNGSNDVTNDGRFELSRGGQLVNVNSVTNRNSFTIAQSSVVQADRFDNTAGTLTNDGRIVADVFNTGDGTLISRNVISGDVQNDNIAELAGRINGSLETTADGDTTVTGNLTVTEGIINRGLTEVAEGATLTSEQVIENGVLGTLIGLGRIDGNIVNAGTVTISGGLTGNLTNNGTATLSGTMTGTLINDSARGADALNLAGSLAVTDVSNRNGSLIVDAGETLTVGNSIENIETGVMSIAGNLVLQSAGALTNEATLNMASTSNLTGSLRNEGTAELLGTISGGVVNHSDADGAGRINGDLINEGATFETVGDLVVGGQVINRRDLSGEASVTGGTLAAVDDLTELTVNAGTTLTATRGLTNEAGAFVVVDGTLIGDVTNTGNFSLNNRLDGSLAQNGGQAALQGTIAGDVIWRDGALSLVGDLSVGGIFDSYQDFTVDQGRTLTTNTYLNRAERDLTVAGNLAAAVDNRGSLYGQNSGQIGSLTNAGSFFVDGAFAVDGAMTNNGTVSMDDTDATDVLTVNGGISGTGVYALDIDLNANNGDGASDRVVVRGGAVTGSITLNFNQIDENTVASDQSKTILVFDVDGSRGDANNFTFNYDGLPQASERIIYSITRDEASGDLYMTDGINPSLGALTGNIALTQSLIGSVVNRPTSPFVPGLATDPGDKPCGPGAWARAVAGRANATGRTTSEVSTAASSIEASYHGLQFGGDLACFDRNSNGWNLAFGVLGGVNDGTTTQPVYLNDSNDPTQQSSLLASINRGEFRQIYAGVYATASRDNLSMDLQLRRERTSFTIDNEPVGGDNQGLLLEDSDFDSNATTLSGSVSYAYALPREGWMIVPTAGFAFSNLSVDTITFAGNDANVGEDTLEIKDSKNRVGFVGGTLSKTFINMERNSAIYAFGTATVYKDFAPDTSSVFTMRDAEGNVTRTDALESSNLGVYGELSLGANYLKVLETGRAGKARQFNASIRVDGRTGDVLDSVGVSAQVRFQF